GSVDMLDNAAGALQQGQTLVIFPEGTRTQPGQAPAFHRGAAAIALRGAKILPPAAKAAPVFAPGQFSIREPSRTFKRVF
ncbi:1-acyl-sn-glycerol-3-phosphate acyltransferase, partial [Roseburia hominis]|nr:1-acyl-sn-glycerol-3-phosphate acyltransferase [Roseburia hominis]